MKRKKRHYGQLTFQITPMIDMTFLLLIFFMVTFKMSKEEVKLDIDLPVTVTAKTTDDMSNRDIINIDGTGDYYLKNDKASKDQVLVHLKKQFKDFPPLRVYIRADKETPARQLKELLRMCSEVGAVDIIIGSYNSESS
jgi:biopolymer transport protein ExbD